MARPNRVTAQPSEPYLDIVIDGGTFTIEAHGFEGQACADFAKAFAELGKVTKTTLKPEYYRTQADVITRRITE